MDPITDTMRKMMKRSTAELLVTYKRLTGLDAGEATRDWLIRKIGEAADANKDSRDPDAATASTTPPPEEMMKKTKSKSAKAPKEPKQAKAKKAPKAPKAPKQPRAQAKPDRCPPKGESFVRRYKGDDIKVTVREDGTFGCGGEQYPSLTALALKITGAKAISGPAFFFGRSVKAV